MLSRLIQDIITQAILAYIAFRVGFFCVGWKVLDGARERQQEIEPYLLRMYVPFHLATRSTGLAHVFHNLV